MDLVAMLPWWVGVALALVSYLALSALAARPVQVAGGVPTNGLLTSSVVKGLASAGQVILPLLFLAGAGMSAFRRRQRRQLLASASQAAAAIDGMRWQEFEMLVGEAYRRQGYQVLESGGGAADGGVDLVLSRPAHNGTEKTLVQCKQWRASKVGVDVVRQLYGVMSARGAAAGIVVTSGRFTAEAQAFAQGRNVRLVDGAALEELIRSARAQPQQRPARQDPPAPPRAAKPAAASRTPACPACGKAMVQRTARRGSASGNRFWGCTDYPACRGTRSIEER
jgi:restriction system protein